MKLKPEEQAELLKFVGLEEAESLEAAKEAFQSKWIDSTEHSAKLGKLRGSVVNVARKAFEPFGVNLTEDDFKDKKIEDVFRSASEAAKTNFEASKKEWEARATGNGSEDVIKEWEKKFKQAEKKAADAEQLRLDAIAQAEAIKNEYAQKEKTQRINGAFDKALASVKIDPTTSEVTLKGFRAVISEKYEFDLDGDAPVVKDRKTGERIKNTQKAGTYLGLDDVLLAEATQLGIIQKNPKAGAPAGGYQPQFQQPNQQPQQPTRLKGVNPRFAGMP